jgi:hypothetical protein
MANHPFDCTCRGCKRKLARTIAERDGGSGSTVGGVAGAIVTGAIALHGAVSSPDQSSSTTQNHWTGSSAVIVLHAAEMCKTR